MMPLQINKPKTPKQNKYSSPLTLSSQEDKNKEAHKTKIFKKKTLITAKKSSRHEKAKLITT